MFLINRERNRVLAKKTRLRKKFFFESLQRQVAQLSSENDYLKSIVKQRLQNELKYEILSQCRTEIPPVVTASVEQATTLLLRTDHRLMTAIQAAQRSFIITDPSIPENPIIFANKGFLELSGYRLDEVIGRNCRFMQGPKTDQSHVEILRKGIQEGVDTAVCLLNYKKDGTTFYNQIFVAALRDGSNKIVNYVGVQVEVQNYVHVDPMKMIPSIMDAEKQAMATAASTNKMVKKSTSQNSLSGKHSILEPNNGIVANNQQFFCNNNYYSLNDNASDPRGIATMEDVSFISILFY